MTTASSDTLLDRIRTIGTSRSIRGDAIVRLQADGRISPEMAAWALDSTLAQYSSLAMSRIASHADLAGRDVAVMLAASVPTAPLRAVVLPMLRGARSVTVRHAREQSKFPELVVNHLSGVGARVALDPPTRHEEFLSPASVGRFHTVFAFGADATIERIRCALTPAVRFEGKRHGIGVAVVTDSAVADGSAAECVAVDVARYDQRGCLSPQVVCVQTATPEGFGRRLAAALDVLARSLPRGSITVEEAVAVAQWQGSVAVRSLSFHRGHEFSVGVLAQPEIVSTPGLRNITVLPFSTWDALNSLLARVRNDVTCFGIAGHLAPGALHTGHARLVSAGVMQEPPLDGPEDPRPPIR